MMVMDVKENRMSGYDLGSHTDNRKIFPRTFFDGIVRGLAAPVMLFDVGTPPPQSRVFAVSARSVSVREALSEDMRRVGQDLRGAMARYAKDAT
jgi:hypothetical protein